MYVDKLVVNKLINELSLIGLLLLYGTDAFAAATLDPIAWPPGFDFSSSIESEDYSLRDFYQTYLDTMVQSPLQSAYGLALANLTLGLERKDALLIGFARALFQESYNASHDAKQKALAKAGLEYAERILKGRVTASTEKTEVVVPVEIKKIAAPTSNFKKIILGKSAIQVGKNSKIKTQVDRVTRDWLQGFNIKNAPWSFDVENIATWHEGWKIRELIGFSGATASVVTGTVAKRVGEEWYAPDAEGKYRFKIAEDKVLNFPSNFVVDDHTVILNDTHGISALAWDALDANLVVGCGDSVGKMEAAYYLATHGVNVYTPTDRFIGMLLGADIKGTVIGSAPVKKAAGGAVVGDQPITLAIDEPIVVSTTRGHYPLQYYDTPYRYFTALADYIKRPLNITPVEVVEYGKADGVVAQARKIGAHVIGIRVWGKVEHEAVKAWLKEDSHNRAILFHTAVYLEGYQLFSEFPTQTSFGDIHPKFE